MEEESLSLGTEWELANLGFLDSGAGAIEFLLLYQVRALPAEGSQLLAHHNLLPKALCPQIVEKNRRTKMSLKS